MPVIIIEGPSVPDLEKKRALAKTVTDAAVIAYGLPEQAMVVVIHENPLECVASGGRLVCDGVPGSPPG